jgi:hypothetical protein
MAASNAPPGAPAAVFAPDPTPRRANASFPGVTVLIEYFGFVLPKYATILNCIYQVIHSFASLHRASSKVRRANLRRENARRSCRSSAGKCSRSSERIEASVCGPCGDAVTKLVRAAIDTSGALGLRRSPINFTFARLVERVSCRSAD